MKDGQSWFNEAKFGLFIHWGPYSQLGVEASWPIMVPGFAQITNGRRVSQAEYEGCAKTFNPVEFDAEKWVRAAKEAGMRYVVFTTKHHDGFCMFDAPGTDYKITNTPFGRDVTAELAAACRKESMRLGFYYSPPDMHHPGFRDTAVSSVKNWMGQPERPEWSTYLDYMEGHLRHLLTAYGDVDLLWFDGLVDQKRYDPDRFHRIIREINPDIVVNDRLGAPGDYSTPEQGIPDGVPVVEQQRHDELNLIKAKLIFHLMGWPVVRSFLRRSYGMPVEDPKPLNHYRAEPYPPEDRFLPWETCITMNRTWAYNPSDTIWKSTDLLIRLMVKVAGKGGNYLLNIGPDSLGRIPEPALDRIDSIGRWMANNGEAIYGTTYGWPTGDANLVVTRNGDAAYVIVLTQPESRDLALSGVDQRFAHALVLESESVVEISQRDDDIEIVLPGGLSYQYPIVVKLT